MRVEKNYVQLSPLASVLESILQNVKEFFIPPDNKAKIVVRLVRIKSLKRKEIRRCDKENSRTRAIGLIILSPGFKYHLCLYFLHLIASISVTLTKKNDISQHALATTLTRKSGKTLLIVLF